MSEAALTLLTLAGVVLLFVTNAVPVEIAAVGSALVLYGLGIITLSEAFAGFSDPAVLLIAGLFVVSEGLDATGVTTWLGQAVVARAGSSSRRLLLLLMLLAAVMTAVIGLNGTIAALLPMTLVVAMRRSMLPSRLLMPLAFAGGAGSLLLLTGTPVNVVVSEAAADYAGGEFGFAEFALVGVPLVIGTLLIVLLVGDRLVPRRSSDDLPPDLSGHAGTLVSHYGLADVAHLRVESDSDLVGSPRTLGEVSDHPGIRLVTVLDGATGLHSTEGAVHPGDRLTLIGDQAAVDGFAVAHRLFVERVRSAEDVQADLLTPRTGSAEIVIPPRSPLADQEVRTSQVIGGGLVVLAITREGQDLGPGPVALHVGDTMLVEGPWSLLDEADRRHDLLVVDSPELLRRQAVPLSQRSGAAIAILVVMVVLLATGAIPASVTALLAAGAMVVLRVVSMGQAYRGINWTTLLLVAGMMPMSTAITSSGAGEMIATRIVDLVGPAGPTALLAGLFVITVVFSQLISNTATALVMIPIGVSAAAQLDISARPVLMSLCVGAAVAFLTPVATPANMMVMGPAGYRFGDYWKLGLPLTILFGLVSVLLVPVIWPF
jgi:di/tricarboxylate transporter